MRMRVVTAALLTLAPMSARAQNQATAALGPLYGAVKGYITKAAEQMSVENYAFKPTPEIRSFGQLVGHVANSTYAICSTAKGEKDPNTADNEKVTDKTALVTALKAAFAYCDNAFTMPDAKFTGTAQLFGMTMTRMGWLMLEVTHANEHYGNMVTYFRLKGLVPPSSQGGM